MAELEERIGRRIKHFRTQKGMTITQLSKFTTISGPQLSRIENGKTSAPVSTLSTIAKALGTKLGFLFEEEESEDPEIVVTPYDGRLKSRTGMHEVGYLYEALAFQKRNKIMEPFFVRVAEGKSDESVVFNHAGEELIFLFKGEMILAYKGDKYFMQPGDSVYFESGVDHSIRNVGKTDLEMLVIMAAP